MCGIFACINEKMMPANDMQKKLFIAVSIADMSRGKDSTGYVLFTPQKSILVKKALNAVDFFSAGYTEKIEKENWYQAIGHNRAASSGAVNDNNAHPFALRAGNNSWDFGCHNGTFVQNIDNVLNTQKFDVDSLVVFNKVVTLKRENRMSLVDAFRSVFGQITKEDLGNYAVLYFDSATKRIYAFRDKERPLYAIQTRNLGLWYCSTFDIFKEAYTYLRVVKVLPSLEKEITNVMMLEPYKIYTNHGNQVVVAGEILTKKERQDLERLKYDYMNYGYINSYKSYYGSFGNTLPVSKESNRVKNQNSFRKKNNSRWHNDPF